MSQFTYVVGLGFFVFALFVIAPAVVVFLFAMPFWILEIAAAVFGKCKKSLDCQTFGVAKSRASRYSLCVGQKQQYN